MDDYNYSCEKLCQDCQFFDYEDKENEDFYLCVNDISQFYLRYVDVNDGCNKWKPTGSCDGRHFAVTSSDIKVSNKIAVERVARWKTLDLNGYPDKDGEYLVVKDVFRKPMVDLVGFVKDLHKLCDYDFPNEKGVPGFYEYSSEYGYYSYDKNDIICWTEVPEMPKRLIECWKERHHG